MSFADAINAALQEAIQQARDYGGLLAQAGMTIEDGEDLGEHRRYVAEGYARQLHDFPNG